MELNKHECSRTVATNQKVGSSNLSGRAIFQPLLPLRVILTCQFAHYIRWLAFPQNYFSLMACTALAPELTRHESDALLISGLVLRSSWRDSRRCFRRRAHPL